jgi:hypothetical protein
MNDMTPLAQEALGVHVMFTAFVEGGFTEDQAIRLVAIWLAERGRNEGGE